MAGWESCGVWVEALVVVAAAAYGRCWGVNNVDTEGVMGYDGGSL